MSRVAFEATCLALDIGFHSGYLSFQEQPGGDHARRSTEHWPHRPPQSPRSRRHRNLARHSSTESAQVSCRSGHSISIVGPRKPLRGPWSVRARSNASLAHRLRFSERSRHSSSASHRHWRHRLIPSGNIPPAFRRRPSHHLAPPPPARVGPWKRRKQRAAGRAGHNIVPWDLASSRSASHNVNAGQPTGTAIRCISPGHE